jgi:hypothetical protein
MEPVRPEAHTRTSQPQGEPRRPHGKFVSLVLASTEDAGACLPQVGSTTRPQAAPVRGRTHACGTGEAAAGPFYCPGDQHVYIDLSFFRLLEERFKAPGDFAQAYVIAHEVGHHVQNLIGLMDKMQAARARLSEKQYNVQSVRLELQADCFAGVWAHHSQKAKGWLEKGDLEEALRAAEAIGDDTIQRSQGVDVPDAFTHGTARQRMQWFQTGMRQGTLAACDTFKQPRPDRRADTGRPLPEPAPPASVPEVALAERVTAQRQQLAIWPARGLNLSSAPIRWPSDRRSGRPRTSR